MLLAGLQQALDRFEKRWVTAARYVPLRDLETTFPNPPKITIGDVHVTPPSFERDTTRSPSHAWMPSIR